MDSNWLDVLQSQNQLAKVIETNQYTERFGLILSQQDAQMILDYEAKLLEDDAEISVDIADVSGDGIVDSNDAVLILQYKDGKIKKFPAEEN